MEGTNVEDVQKISTFRRFFPQILGSSAKNLMLLNLGFFAGFRSIVIPSLIGINKELNPDETVFITSAEASWLASFAVIAHPIGSLLSGTLSDKIGRRTTIRLIAIPITIAWIILGFAYSFTTICLGFALLGFLMGLTDSSAVVYISEPSIRGSLLSVSPFFYSVGMFLVRGLGSMLSWRQVSFICSLAPFCCIIASIFLPETPAWLISQGRLKDGQKSLQWLRGWVSLQTVQKEFTELQNLCNFSNACSACEKQSIKCYHPKPTFVDKIKDLKRKRNLKPAIFILFLIFFDEFSGMNVWQPYIVQVLIALGIPMNPNLTATLISGLAIVANFVLLLLIKNAGRRKLYFISTTVVIICGIGLSVYGFIVLPSSWTSFKEHPEEPLPNMEHIRQIVGNCGYFALALVLLMQFSSRIGLSGIGYVFVGEVFPFKCRSFMSGLVVAFSFLYTSIASKTYYDVEMWLCLPGTILFYAIGSLAGLIIMYLIMPETEGRSLEDIEIHFSDNSKKITDIHIAKRSKTIE